MYTWLRRNKTQRDLIRKERKRKLEQIGIDLYHDPKTEGWESMYVLLKKFKKLHGHVSVTSSKSASISDQKLYHWLQGQMYLKKHGQLGREREKWLQQLDLLWYLPNYERRWHRKLEEFVAFKKAGKHLYISWDTPLRRWLYWQKKNLRRLPDKKKKILFKVGVLRYLDNAGTRHSPGGPDLSSKTTRKKKKTTT